MKIRNSQLEEPNNGEAKIEIPKDLLIKEFDDLIKAIVNNTYLSFLQHFNNLNYLKDHAILTPKLDTTDLVNSYMLSLILGEFIEYYSLDSIYKSSQNGLSNEEMHTTEILNDITTFGMLNHKLLLKVGILIMLLRNID